VVPGSEHRGRGSGGTAPARAQWALWEGGRGIEVRIAQLEKGQA
jgi:hypothetical protein